MKLSGDEGNEESLRVALTRTHRRPPASNAEMAACLPTPDTAYDFAERSLVLWPVGKYEVEVRYELDERPQLMPRPFDLARSFDLPSLSAERVIYSELPMPRNEWSQFWAGDGNSTETRAEADDLIVLPQQVTLPSLQFKRESASS